MSEQWAYYATTMWQIADAPGRDAAIDEALEAIALEEGPLVAGLVVGVTIGLVDRPSLSDYLGGQELLEQLDERQYCDGGQEWGSIAHDWSREQRRARVAELEEEVRLAIDRWCDRHGVEAPWWSVTARETIRVKVIATAQGYAQRWEEVAP